MYLKKKLWVILQSVKMSEADFKICKSVFLQNKFGGYNNDNIYIYTYINTYKICICLCK